MEKTRKDFKQKDLPISDFAKIGISKDALNQRPDDLKALLSGNISKTFKIEKFKSLDIEARLQLQQLGKNKIQLLVFPDKMEIKRGMKRQPEQSPTKDRMKVVSKSKQEKRGYSKGLSR